MDLLFNFFMTEVSIIQKAVHCFGEHIENMIETFVMKELIR